MAKTRHTAGSSNGKHKSIPTRRPGGSSRSQQRPPKPPRAPAVVHEVTSGGCVRSYTYEWQIENVDATSKETLKSTPFQMQTDNQGSLAKWSLSLTPSLEDHRHTSKLSLHLEEDSDVKNISVSCEFRILGDIVENYDEDEKVCRYRQDTVMNVLNGVNSNLNFMTNSVIFDLVYKAEDDGVSGVSKMEADGTCGKSSWGVLWSAKREEAMKLGTLTVVVVISPKSSVTPEARFMREISALFNDPTFSDLTLTSGHESFAVHKNIVAARSAQFAAMISEKLAKKPEGNIIVVDTKPEVLQQLLHFIYSCSAPRLAEMAPELYRAAMTYDLPDLRKACADHMSVSLTADNVLPILELVDTDTHTHDTDTFKKCVLAYFRSKYISIMKTPQWNEFLASHPVLANKVLTSTLLDVGEKRKRKRRESPEREGSSSNEL